MSLNTKKVLEQDLELVDDLLDDNWFENGGWFKWSLLYVYKSQFSRFRDFILFVFYNPKSLYQMLISNDLN